MVISGLPKLTHLSAQRESTRRRAPTHTDDTSPRLKRAWAGASEIPVTLANCGMLSNVVWTKNERTSTLSMMLHLGVGHTFGAKRRGVSGWIRWVQRA